MLNLLRQAIHGKKLLILGFGREGKSTLKRILQVGGFRSLAVADQNRADAGADIPVLTGPSYMDTLDDYDLVFKSPGIVLPKALSEYRCTVTSQMDFFIEAYREQVIGITGTKGKSTTTTLLYHILKESGRDCVLAGNIGIPAFDILEDLHRESLIMCELSCHQLEFIHVSPHMGVLLNVHEEHLDHYGSMEKYVRAKQQIYLHQQPGDYLFCGMNVLPPKGACPASVISVSDCFASADVLLTGTKIRFEDEDYRIPANAIHLLGHHNHLDIAFVYAICKIQGLTNEEFESGLKSYHPLPHRLSFIGEQDGIRYYDDSISTICDTTIQALKSIPDVGTVLIGGMDRGIDYTELIRFLEKDPVPHIILMEATGKRIYEEIQSTHPGFSAPERLILVPHLQDAIAMAKKITAPGQACVLSPAAASYGIFKNFEERGDTFTRLVLHE